MLLSNDEKYRDTKTMRKISPTPLAVRYILNTISHTLPSDRAFNKFAWPTNKSSVEMSACEYP